MNWADTPLLVYASLDGHPARTLMARELDEGTWGSTVWVLSECYQVLTQAYEVAPATAADAVEQLARLPIHWAPLDANHILEALAIRASQSLQTGDALLLVLARKDHGTLVTQDRRLLRVAHEHGVAVRNAISPQLAGEISRWEVEHLPAKGLPRLLQQVERWLREREPALADQFMDATSRLSALP